MTTEHKIARRKLSLLELATDINNVSKACKLMGYSRQQFYEIRRNYQTYGAEGLIDRLPGPKGPHPNRVDEAVEKAILDYSLQYPPLMGHSEWPSNWFCKALRLALVASEAYGAVMVC